MVCEAVHRPSGTRLGTGLGCTCNFLMVTQLRQNIYLLGNTLPIAGVFLSWIQVRLSPQRLFLSPVLNLLFVTRVLPFKKLVFSALKGHKRRSLERLHQWFYLETSLCIFECRRHWCQKREQSTVKYYSENKKCNTIQKTGDRKQNTSLEQSTVDSLRRP